MSVPVAPLMYPENGKFTSQLLLPHQESEGGNTHYQGLFSSPWLSQNLAYLRLPYLICMRGLSQFKGYMDHIDTQITQVLFS